MTKYGDLKFFYHPTEVGEWADIRIEDGDFIRDEGLFTAVLISLFSDARVDPKDADNAGMGGDPRGFWGDVLIDYNLGSRLWLLTRRRLDNETLRLWEQYCDDALQWMIDENVAKTITTTAWKTTDKRLGFEVSLKGPGEDEIETFKFKLEWQAMAA